MSVLENIFCQLQNSITILKTLKKEKKNHKVTVWQNRHQLKIYFAQTYTTNVQKKWKNYEIWKSKSRDLNGLES